MGSHEPALKAAGIQVVAVGQGEPKHAERFCGKLAPEITCLTDPTVEPYYRYGLRQGAIGELLSLDIIKAGARAAKDGHIQDQATGDTRMVPGSFIVDTGGIIRHIHYNRHPGDHPNLEALIIIGKMLRLKS